MASEVDEQRMGAATVMTRLADAVVTRVVREWVESQTGPTSSWLAAIRDPQIGRVLADFHREPDKEWSDQLLGRLSKSVPLGIFRTLYGDARYIARTIRRALAYASRGYPVAERAEDGRSSRRQLGLSVRGVFQPRVQASDGHAAERLSPLADEKRRISDKRSWTLGLFPPQDIHHETINSSLRTRVPCFGAESSRAARARLAAARAGGPRASRTRPTCWLLEG